MKIFYIDLFSGAGGTTTGIHLAGNEDIKVVACVNHDEKAIESHKANHSDCLHFIEDVRDMKVIIALQNLVKKLRSKYPDCIINIWASLECTNYSKAKGGLPRDADSRTLAYALYDYAEKLNPDNIFIENVREFMSWGPLDKNGKPISRLNGRDYIRWIKQMCSYGYYYDWKLLNSADFGAYTSRERYFGQFAKNGLPISWPVPTHAKKISINGLFSNQFKPWKPVKEVLDLHDEGESIFTRKKPLVEATLKRIYAGLIKFVANGDTQFTYRYNGGNPYEKAKSINNPIGSISTNNRHSIVKASFLTSYYGNSNGAQSITKPSPTVTTKDRFTLVNANFIDNQYGQSKATNINNPIGTIAANPKQNLVTVKPWIMNTNFSNIGSSIDVPAQTILASRKHHYLMNPQFQSKGSSIDKPCFTLIARMDKTPPYLIEANKGEVSINIKDSDSEAMKLIKKFMQEYNIIDIKMRMLKISELLKIQGFPPDYILIGTKNDQKKFIGNAVVPIIAKAIALANSNSLKNELRQVI